ncbi:recombinase family protein [Photobacterium profundum]|uniref:recombinase family protein n=1 Tax=Photobacterium profundum TaxID=74109 RepID=UPI003D12F34C
MKLAYSYIRFSSLEQAKGDSFRRQTEQARLYCDSNGLDLADLTFKDLGLSAYHGKHVKDGDLGNFIQAVKEGNIQKGSYLIVESMDRLNRQKVSTSYRQLSELLELDINIVTLQDNRIYTKESLNNLGDIMMSLVTIVRAYEESEIKSQRLKAAHEEKRKQARENHKPTGYNMPHWIKLTDTSYELIPDRVSIIKRIFQMSIDGLGATAIHKQLNAEGLKPWGRSKTGWHPSYIKKLLSSSTLLGEYQPYKNVDGKRTKDGETIPGYYPPALDPITFKRAALAIKSRKGKQTGTRKNHVNNLFTGLLICQNCGSSMHYINKGSGSKGGQYLVCSRARQGAHHDGISCKYASMRYPIIEDAILTVAVTLNLKVTPNGNKEEIDQLKELLSHTASNLKTAEIAISNFKEAIAKRGPQDAYLDAIEQNEEKKKVYKKEKMQIEQRIDELELTPLSSNVWKELKKTLQVMKKDAADRSNVELRAKISSLLANCIERIEFDALEKLVTVVIDEQRNCILRFDAKQKGYMIKPSWDRRELLPNTFAVKETVRNYHRTK